MASATAQKVNGDMLRTRVGQVVDMMARVEASGASALQVQTSDAKAVTVHFHHPVQAPTSAYIQIIGQVQSNGEINATEIISLPGTMDLAAWEEVVKHVAIFPTLF